MIAGMLSHAVAFDDDQAKELEVEFTQQIQPLLMEKCGDCHQGTEATAGVNVAQYRTLEQVLDADRKWRAILEQVESGAMPPEDEAESLSKQEQEKLVAWITQTFELVDCAEPIPGNVTIRKLNRLEYRNSIRDLLGVDYAPSANFPGDDVGHGFDNIADVMSLPPILMEKYLDAGEEVTQRAIVDPNKPPMDVSLSGTRLNCSSDKSVKNNGSLMMYSNATAEKTIQFPLVGEYMLKINAHADSAGSEFAKMMISLDGELVRTVDVKANRRKPEWFTMSLNLRSKGTKKLQVAFINDFFVPQKGRKRKQDRNLYVSSVEIRGPKVESNGRNYLNLKGQSTASARKFIWEFLPRAFRRPVEDQLKQEYLQLFQQYRQAGHSFYEAIRHVTQAALVSPRFLYRLEAAVPDNSIRELDQFELATALSYFLWSSTPDDNLLRTAGRRQLQNSDVLATEVRRMLADKRSISLVDNFAAQWLNLPVLKDSQPDPGLFPRVDKQLLEDMGKETRMVIADIFRRDASVLELLECDFSFMNQRLAAHYQLENIVAGDRFQRVSLPRGSRQGVLTHASILTLTSNPDRTSPVKRGKWVMENILGDEPPPPLASVVPLEDQQELTGSLRERMEKHRSDPSCAACHSTMDALGFAMENYDAVGRFRLNDDGFQIDARSELPDGTTLEGATGLQNQLKTTYKAKFVRCFTEKLLTYALGRGLKYFDRCTVDRIIEQAEKQNYRFSAFVQAIVASEPFRKRGGVKRVGSDNSTNNGN